ncbi:MAG: LytR/AlgR family response regulator transcription factor [Longimicrobiales bacterium]
MAEIRVVVVDDEPMARAGLQKLLHDDPELEVVGEAGNGRDAVALIRRMEPDLLFLDIQMPELNGFEVLAQLGPQNMPVTVFVTAYDQFALRAFEVQALDYLLKPFEDERFLVVLRRAKDEVRRARRGELTDRLEHLVNAYSVHSAGEAEGKQRAQFLTRIIVREGGTVTFMPVDEIDWIEAADYYAKLHGGATVQLVRFTMNELEHQLDPDRFVRVHRSAIVNVSRVKEIRVDYQNHHVVVLRSGIRVPLSRRRRDMLEGIMSRAR